MSTEERAEAPATRATVKGPRFGDFSEMAIVLVFAAIVIYLSLTSSTFLSSANIMAILVATSLIAVVACGQTFVIITGGIDLSSGSVVALSGVITGLVLHAGVPIWASIGVGISVGLACGLFNGLSVTYLNMNPFIVTLAAMSMARGLAFIIPNGQTIFGFDDAFDSIGGGLWTIPGIGRAPIAGVISLAALAIGAFVLKKTVFGSEVYSVGGNRDAAVIAGIPVRRTLISVYAISGALAGLGGVILTGRLDFGSAHRRDWSRAERDRRCRHRRRLALRGSRLHARHDSGRASDRGHQQWPDASQCRAVLGSVHSRLGDFPRRPVRLAEPKASERMSAYRRFTDTARMMIAPLMTSWMLVDSPMTRRPNPRMPMKIAPTTEPTIEP